MVEAERTASQTKRDTAWEAASLGLVAMIMLGVRWGTAILAKRPIFDEGWIMKPIRGLVENGWSVATAIDFEETKGPGMIWPYAALGQIVRGELNGLRMISVMFTIACVGPMVWLARRSGVHGWAIAAVALVWILLPQQIVLGELLMSEPIFTLQALLLAMAVVCGLERRSDGLSSPQSTVWWPIAYAVLLSIMLHTRVHAVAFAGATCLLASARLGRGAWIWWAASLVAGLSRIPLWLRWGGLVSPAYQDMHQLGGVVHLEHCTYLVAALAPIMWGLIAAAFVRRDVKWWPVFAGSAGGLVLALVAMPSMADVVPLPEVVSRGGPQTAPKYLGLLATGLRGIESMPGALHAMAVIGGGSLGALASLARRESVAGSLLAGWTLWTLLAGIAMYALNAGFVFDRYLLPWCAVLPIVMVKWLPRPVLVVQLVLLAVVAGVSVRTWLM
jgi:hypothetical protein